MYKSCILKTTELLDCVLIRLCAVVRSNTVFDGEERNTPLSQVL